MVRYTVKPEDADRNESLVRAVYAQLEQARPPAFRYATFKLDDGVTFMHIASLEPGAKTTPLSQLTAFGEFQAGLKDRCDVPPQVTELERIGWYGWAGS